MVVFYKLSLFVAVILFLVMAPIQLEAGAEDEKKNDFTASESQKVKDFIMSVSDEVITLLKDQSIPDKEKERKLEEKFKQHVDATWMGIFVMGRYFNALSNDEQKKAYIKLYNDYLVSSYVPKFRNYTSVKFDIIEVRSDSPGEFIVKTTAKNGSNEPDTRVDYRIRRDKAGNYKVIDIIGEGISLIATQRSDFSGIISQKGLDGFLKRLEERVKELRTETAAGSV